ncbi:MAG: glycosyltransferase [Bacteroidetes bacterium]|nr:glycosyltransferase [Bacteroidota bacterium]
MIFEEFKNIYQKKEVQTYQNTVAKEPLVSVCIQAYNHEPYISQCIDSVIAQETDFEFEILIGEDQSSDATRAICMEYAKNYPTKIRLFLHHRENNIAIAGKPTGKFNFLYNLYSANGTFIALCDGDDYWIENTKLQKQYNFMKEHIDCSFVFHNTRLLEQESGKFKKDPPKPTALSGYKMSRKHMFTTLGGSYPTGAAFFKSKIVKDLPSYFFQFLVGDSPLLLRAIEYGEIGYLHGYWSVYRMSNTNWSSTQKSVPTKLIHYKASQQGLTTFDTVNGGKFSKEVIHAKGHSTYQLVHFYLTLSVSFSNKLKFISTYAGKLSFKNLLKSFYWLIRYQLS